MHLKMQYDDHMPESDATGLGDFDKSLTHQSFAEEADINTIVRRFGLTGELPSDVRMPMNGDFSDVPDLRAALHILMEARDSFMSMPADVRARFNNDPARLMDFCSNPDNKDEAIKLGFVERPLPPVKDASLAALEAIRDAVVNAPRPAAGPVNAPPGAAAQ